MAMIRIENLTFGYPTSSENVFEEISLQIDTSWKLGLVGRNGRGKTTLLRLLENRNHQYEYRGRIQSPVLFDYFPYDVQDKDDLTINVLETVCPEALQWQIVRELSLLEVEEEVLWRPFSTLSNGEQTKILLAALFLNEGHFLLIDEPTNHLDTHGRKVVANYLQRKKGFILVSHDRAFLDGCIDHVLAINRSTLEIQSGTYSSWAENFEKKQAAEQNRHTLLKKEITAMQKSARQTAGWSDQVEASKYGNGPVDRGYIGHKSAKMMKRAKAIEKRKNKAIEEKSGLLQDLEEVEDLKLAACKDLSGTMVSLHDVVCEYDGKPICEPVSFSVQKKDRIVLDGGNGSGKSTLLKLICRQPIAYSGDFYAPARLKISYVPQNTSFLQGDLKQFALDSNVDESLLKAILRKMGFERVQFEKNLESFSAGQKKKVLIACSLCQQAHLYVWDEPLNYIDIDSRKQIEDLILSFEPTMILVEHDQAFQDKIATQKISICPKSKQD
ncbi:ABC-F type ribosomal protection protein [Erysipelotrichaceae bacterium RD49]|nr:ABC-F type ribosomal protection protein [Erysipelotrichaceae bacterium RD49]